MTVLHDGHNPFSPREPFSRAEARAAGLLPKMLLSARFHKIFHDLYVSSDVAITAEVRALAALKASPEDAYVSHHSAVELWGAVAPATSSTHVSVATAIGRTERQGVKAHVGKTFAQTTMLRGLPISTPEQAFIDVAGAGAEILDLVIVGDSLVRAKRTTPQLLTNAAHAWNAPGGAPARRAARLVRSGVDSPMETRLRLLLVFAGLPEPVVNFIMRDPEGGWRLRFDLCYEHLKLTIEYDGRQHAESDEQWSRDIFRREELDRMSWRLIIINYRGIYVEPERTLERVRDALVGAGSVGIPGGFANDWRR